MSRFDFFINRVLGHEGGYTPGKNDPGGETNWGISKRSYPALNIRTLSRDQAIAIYRRDFWDPIKGELLGDAVSYQALDAAINSGPVVAIRWLQQAIGVADDGHFGPVSLKALRAADQNDVLMRFLAVRLEFMTRLSNWPNASRGWARRIAQNLRFAAADN